jgi:hypothetical protein
MACTAVTLHGTGSILAITAQAVSLHRVHTQDPCMAWAVSLHCTGSILAQHETLHKLAGDLGLLLVRCGFLSGL